MNDVSGIGSFGSDAAVSVLSNKERQYFKRVFETSLDTTSQSAAQPAAPAKPGVGTRLNVKV